jgi:hypothetical protein
MTDRLTGVIFEKGITLQRLGRFWKCLNSSKPLSLKPTEIETKFEFRPVMKKYLSSSTKNEIYVLLSAKRRQSLTNTMSKISNGLRGVQFYPFEPMRIGYSLRDVAYHCLRLAQNYSDLCIKSIKHNLYSQVQGKSLIAILEWVEPCYFEVEACLTSLIRAYELIRYPISNKVCLSKSTPKSYDSLLKQIRNKQSISSPEYFVENIVLSSEREFNMLKSYRDCLQHYTFLSAPISQGILLNLEFDVRACHLYLPDNPDCRSFNNFRYKHSVDSLTFCWEATTYLVTFINKLTSYLWREESKT